MTKREKRFFNVAKKIAHSSDFTTAHIGAIVVEGKTILSTGKNSEKTSPLQHKYNVYRDFNKYEYSIPKQHAEINALNRLIGKEVNWANTSIYIYRELKDGTPACSKPCPACDNLIKVLGIKNIYYIDLFGNFVKERVL